MAVPVTFKVVTLDPLLSNVQPNISIQSLAPQKTEKQLHSRALLSPTGFLRSRAPKVWVVSLGGPGRKELAPFRGQRSDVAGHGQGIQPRCWSSLSRPQCPIVVGSPDSNCRTPRHLWTRERAPRKATLGPPRPQRDPRQSFQNSPSDIQTTERQNF